jgi:MFS family permease
MEKKQSKLALIGIFALFATISEFTILTPALDTLTKAFSDTPLTTILLANTITGLVSVPVSLLVGLVVNKVGFKMFAIIGLLLATLGGAYPYLMFGLTDYMPIIFSRILVGIGMGIINPLGAALIIRLYHGKQRASYLGIGSLVMCLSGVVYQTISGQLTTLGWNYSFLAYLITFVPFVLVIIFLPEVKGDTDEAEAMQGNSASREKIPAAAWGYILLVFGALAFTTMAVMLASSVLADRGMGDAGVAGIVTSMFTVGGVVLGATFGIVLGVLKKYILAVFAIMAAIGFCISFFTSNVILYSLGVVIISFGHYGILTACQNAAGSITPKSRVGFVSGAIMAAMNVGTFTTSYIIASVYGVAGFLGTGGPMVVGAAVIGIAGIVMFFLPFKSLSMQAVKPAAEIEE